MGELNRADYSENLAAGNADFNIIWIYMIDSTYLALLDDGTLIDAFI